MGLPSEGNESLSAQKGARLLRVVASLFRAKGYTGTSTREVAKRMGMQSASLYHYFGEKEDLLYAICVGSVTNSQLAAESVLRQRAQPIECLKALIRIHVETILADQDKHATQFLELRALSEPRRKTVVDLRRAYESLLENAIAECQAEGTLRRDVPSKQLCLMLLGLLNWPVFWFRSEGEIGPKQLADRLATLFVEGAGCQSHQIDK